jgi:hypothetical protein
MLPSPSEGPPWLSESASPALAPCGIPEAPPAAELLEDVVELEEAAAGVLEDGWAAEDWVADELEVDEPPPQAATSSAMTTAAAANDAR